MAVDLESSIKEQGQWVTKIIHFIHGEKRTIEGVHTYTVRQDDSYLMVNDKNVLMIEVFSEK